MFPRIDEALRASREHLDATATRGTEIEPVFVGYALTVIHAEFEQHIVAIVASRCHVEGDARLTAYMANAVQRLVKKIAISDLAGVLGAFHDECKQRFSDDVINTQHHTSYDNIITNRQNLAHRQGTNLTFAELESAYAASLTVLEAFGTALAT